jgi:hypothetical protein
MKLCSAALVLSLSIPVSAIATTIPPDLEARAAELQRQAPPQVLAWVHDQGLALARARAPIDLAALEQGIRLQFASKGSPAARKGGDAVTATRNILGDLSGSDIEALVFLVLMQASKSAHEDLKAIMDGVKARNREKKTERALAQKKSEQALAQEISNSSATPTPASDRLTQLAAAARSVVGKTHGANLAGLARR